MYLRTIDVTRFLLIGTAVFLCSASCLVPAAQADGASVAIQSVFPSGGITPGQAVTFYASAVGFANASYALTDSFSGTSAASGDINNNGFFTWTPAAADAGLHTITVTVTDTYGHSATATTNILVVSAAILIQSLSPGQTVVSGRTVTFTATAPGFITPSFTVTDGYAGTTVVGADMNSSSGVFTWSPAPNEQGLHTLTLSASDVYGHAATAHQTITVISPSLTIASLAPSSAVAPVGTHVSFTAVDPSMTNPTMSLADSFNSFTSTSTLTTSNLSSSGVFSWTPTTSDIGIHTLLVSATDSLGNTASTTQTLVVTAASAPLTPSMQPAISPPSAPTNTAPGASSAVTTAPKGDGYVFGTALGIGSRGAAATELQKRLTLLGFYTGPVTGYYGAMTASAVKVFQKAHGISAIGSVGPATRAALNH